MKFRRPAIIAVLALVIFGSQTAAAYAEETFTFSGRGTAHGVGLDMAGVEALARQGRGHEDILKTYYSGVSFAGGREGEELRVGILDGGELQFTGDSGYTVYANNSGPGAHVARDVITHVTYENGQYVTRIDGVGTWRLPGFTRLQADGGGRLKILNNGRRYRGRLEARRSSTGVLWAIEVTNIENYIKGIAEEPNTWPREAQRTLATAARTYALNKKLYSTRWDSENFDIDATRGSQYYLGYDAERSNLVQAVADTRGKVITYDNKIIVAAYHGNSGGHTESLTNVWGGSGYPYLRGVASPWTPVHSWGPKTFTKSQLQDIFNSHSEGYIGRLDSIDLSNRSPSGRLYKVKITGSAGTKELWGFSQFAGWLGLPSALLDGGGEAAADNWDEFILLVNPNNAQATVRITFIFPDGPPKLVVRRVRAKTRRTIAVDRLVPAGAVSARIKSDLPIVAERSVYFANDGDGGGHNSLGARSASRRWYFAEGRTGSRFDTYLIVTNPTSAPTVVKATFMPGNGRRIKKRIRVPAFARREILVDGVHGLATAAAPAVVSSSKPVVVERVTYFKNSGMSGGYASVGSPTLSNTWYFSEGYTGPGSINRLMVFNPSNAATTARVTLNRENGAQVSRDFAIAARSRRSILLNNMLADEAFGIKVTAGRGVVAERTAYFNSGGKTGAHSSIGSPNASNTWYFAEGNTGSGFDKSILALSNLSGNMANVTIEYFAKGGGATVTRLHSLGPNSRKTIFIGDTSEMGPGRMVGMKVAADQPIMAERVMYFSYPGNRGQSIWSGGHVSIGAANLSRRWFFAEGYNQ